MLRGNVYFQARPQSFRAASDAGDYVGGGVTKTYQGATSTFRIQGTAESVQLDVSGLRDNWTIFLTAPEGQVLQPKTYRASHYRTASTAGLEASTAGRQCFVITGSVTVREIRLGDAGQVIGLDASFVQRCEGGTPALRGTIRYEAGAFPAPPVVTAPTGLAPASRTVVRR